MVGRVGPEVQMAEDAASSSEAQAPEPYTPERTTLRDFSIKAVVAGIVFGALFGTANAYLGLRVGLTIGTSIPLAVIMVALFRSLRSVVGRTGILEWNIGQAAGSSASSLASGLIFTVPALFMWSVAPAPATGILQFGALALCGGLLGVLFMVPLRRFLIVKEHAHLPYPEGTAAAQLLIAADAGGSRARQVFQGLALGAVYKALMGLARLWPGEVSLRVPVLPKAQLGIEPTPALIGVGYILGYRVSAIMVAGGLLSWLCLIPLIAHFGDGLTVYLFPQPMEPPRGPLLIREMTAAQIWTNYVRYVGAGAVAAAGIIAVVRNVPIMVSSLRASLRGWDAGGEDGSAGRLGRDLPARLVFLGAGAVILFLALTPHVIGVGGSMGLRLLAAVCVAVFAFVFVTVAARIVGLVGVTSNPTSGMAIVTLLGTATVFYALGWTDEVGKAAVLTTGTVVCVAASIGGDMSQDLKCGHLIGATPAKQQTAELLGVIGCAFAIAAAVYLLGSQYGFGGKDFPAPQATLMKTVIEGVLSANLPWGLVLTGAALAVMAALLGVPPLAFAVGVYLPLSAMTPVFVGGCLRALVDWRARRAGEDPKPQTDRGMLLGSGLIAGEGLTGVAIALWAFVAGRKPAGVGLELPGLWGDGVSLLAFAALGWVLVWASRRQAATNGSA
jgi:putative OPT family oligopeptide transporter